MFVTRNSKWCHIVQTTLQFGLNAYLCAPLERQRVRRNRDASLRGGGLKTYVCFGILKVTLCLQAHDGIDIMFEHSEIWVVVQMKFRGFGGGIIKHKYKKCVCFCECFVLREHPKLRIFAQKNTGNYDVFLEEDSCAQTMENKKSWTHSKTPFCVRNVLLS